jgi:cysteine synthase
VSLLRLFNEPAGVAYLRAQGVPEALVERLSWLGISCIANVLAAVKMAKYYELTSSDTLVTVLTDSVAMYHSRLEELTAERGAFTATDAAVSFHRYMLGQGIDHLQELTYQDRKRVHNLKYYTWVEQQGRTHKEIQAQWYDSEYWTSMQQGTDALDARIEDFNRMTALQPA